MTIPDAPATTLRAGDTLVFNRSFPDYPAPAWTVVYALANQSGTFKDFSVAIVGSGFTVTLPASKSAAYTAGLYQLQEAVSNSVTGEVYTTGVFPITILPSLIASNGPLDIRTTARQIYDAITATLQGRATVAQEEMTIGGRMIKYLSPRDLRREWKHFEREVKTEEQEQRIANGLGSGSAIKARFAPIGGIPGAIWPWNKR